MKKSASLIITTIGLIVSLLFTNTTAFASTNIDQRYTNVYDQNKSFGDSNEEVYKEIFVTLLAPYIDKAIEDYYGKPYAFAPWAVDILSIEKPNPSSGSFIIKLQVIPYIGAHNSVGIDNITIKVSYGEEPKVEKFEHIK